MLCSAFSLPPRAFSGRHLFVIVGAMMAAGCATPQYAIRGTPMPDESPGAVEIERSISAVQAQEFERQGARPIGLEERVSGFAVQRLVNRLSAVTERPSLRYRKPSPTYPGTGGDFPTPCIASWATGCGGPRSSCPADESIRLRRILAGAKCN